MSSLKPAVGVVPVTARAGAGRCTEFDARRRTPQICPGDPAF
jgi:hypothetical protein